ncbi:MAG: hypothetical protein KGV56_03240 [Gammaproteobacteria bacterium]|nr:hypothetical protein [Gammaproteobacteria bacterium]
MKIELSLADPSDDKALRQLLQKNILEGHLGVSFRREPNYFTAAAIQGKTYEIIKGTDTATQALVGLAGRFTYPAYVNGEKTSLGYLAELRIAPEYRSGLLMARGFRLLRQLHQQSPVNYYTTMILDGNIKAFNTLTTQRAGLPAYIPQGRVLTPAIHLDMPKKALSLANVTVEKAHSGNIAAVFDFINRVQSQKQFAPYYQVSDLGTPRLQGLSANDFYVAIKNNQIIGVVAAWEQSDFRQIYVEKYSPTLKAIKPFYNVLSLMTPLKPLPKTGSIIPYFYLSFIAIKDNDADVFRLLLNTLYRERYRGKWHYFICGLHEDDDLSSVLSEYRRIESCGHLFTVDLDNTDQNTDQSTHQLDNKIPYIEIATL